MNPLTHLGAILLLLLTLSGCQTPSPSTDDRLINQYGNLAIYQTPQKRYYVIQSGKRVYEDLNYATCYNQKILALDSHNHLKQLPLKPLNEKPVPPPRLLCGNVEATHFLEIQSRPHSTQLYATVKSADDDKHPILQPKKRILSIPHTQADSLYFAPHQTQLEIEADTIESITIYFQKAHQYGILGTLQSHIEEQTYRYTFTPSPYTQRYDELIILRTGDLRLRQGKLWGYYLAYDDKMIEPKYQNLSSFERYYDKLARVERADGRKGYIDRKGREYWDE